MNRTQGCRLCHTGDDVPGHPSSLLHRFNFALFEWNRYRPACVKNRDGVEVDVELMQAGTSASNLNYTVNEKKGRHETRLTEIQAAQEMQEDVGISYIFTVKNIQNSKSACLTYVRLLHPYSAPY